MDGPPSYEEAMKLPPKPILSPGKDLDLLLWGKSDLRNITTGNSLLGRRVFTPLGDGEYHQVGFNEVDERVIKIMDILGFNHADCSSSKKAAEFVIDALGLENGLGHFPRGYDAILFTLSYTKPITKEEQKAIKALKQILGDDVFKKRGICVVTYGDSFDGNRDTIKVDDFSFQLWCKDQKGFTKDFFEECFYRCVLVDNTSHDESLQKSQLVDLVKHVDSLGYDRDTRYSFESFLASRKDSERCTMECKLPVVLEKLSRQISLTQDALQKVIQSPLETRPQALTTLKVKERANTILQEIDQSESEKLYSLRPDLEPLPEIIAEYEFQSCDMDETKGIEMMNRLVEITKEARVTILDLTLKEEQCKDYHEWITTSLGPLLEKQPNTMLTIPFPNTKIPNPLYALKRIQLMKRARSGARRVGGAVNVPVEFVTDVVFPVLAEGAAAAAELAVEAVGAVIEGLLE